MEDVTMKTFACMSCLNVFDSSDKKPCGKCNSVNVVQTYNANDGRSITNRDLY